MSHLYEEACNIKVNDGALKLTLKNYVCYKNSLRIKCVRAVSLGFAHKFYVNHQFVTTTHSCKLYLCEQTNRKQNILIESRF